jgi:parallel beta-helix repeat protein
MVAYLTCLISNRNIAEGGRFRLLASSFALSFLFLLSFSADAKVQKSSQRNASMIDREDDMSGNDVDRSKVDCCILKTVTAINQKLACNSAISFGSADINKPGGYVITEPGLYCLKEDVVFSPRFSSTAPTVPTAPYTTATPAPIQAAITIMSSDVFLDLGAHTLSQAGAGTSTQVPYAIGILIPDMIPNSTNTSALAPGGLQSIYIKGDDPAIIEGFSMFGIRVFGHVYDLRLTNITVKDGAALASKALRPTPNYFPHSNELTAYGPGFAVAGICIGESSGFGMGPVFFTEVPFAYQNRVSEVVLENVSVLNNFSDGLILVNTTDYTINNCHFDDTYSDDPGFNDTQPNGSQGPLAYECIPSYNANMWGGGDNLFESNINGVTTNSTFNGSQLRGNYNTKIISFNDHTVDAIIPSFPCFGLLETHAFNTQYINCQFNNSLNTAIGGTIGGYLASAGAGSTLENCSFNGHQAISSINAYHHSGTTEIVPGGVTTVISCTSLKVINCTANDNLNISNLVVPPGVPPTNYSIYAYHFDYGHNFLIEGCTANNNYGNGPNNGGAIVGFHIICDSNQNPTPPNTDATVKNITLRNCIASDNAGINGGLALGFEFVARYSPPGTIYNAMKSVTVENCISTGNYTLAPTTAGITQGTANGFYIVQNSVLPVPGDQYVSYPMLFKGCVALHNKGFPTGSDPNLLGAVTYSAGFYVANALKVSLVDCDAIDNVYGIFLQKSNNCTVRNCRSDSNVDILYVPGTGAGFTDVGTPGVPAGKLGTPASPGVTTSLFEFNHAYNNGNGATQIGQNGNYNVFVDPATATVPLPTLQGQVSTSTYAYLNPAFYTPVHNIAIVE